MTTELQIGHHCEISIRLCAARRTDWLAAIRVDDNRVRVTADDKVWRGCIVNLKDAGLKVRASK
jgi:hypothetical protein